MPYGASSIGHVAGHRLDRALGAVVDRGVRVAGVGADRADVDDPPADPALDHVPRGVLGQDERRAEVDVDLLLPVVVGHLPEVAADAHPGVVDQDVEPRDQTSASPRPAGAPRSPARDRPGCPRPRRRARASRRPTASTASGSRPETTMFAPSRASHSAIVRPSPRVLPVTSAVCPARRRGDRFAHGRIAP